MFFARYFTISSFYYSFSFIHHQPTPQLQSTHPHLGLPTLNHTTNALASLAVLQNWYNTSSGLWDTTGWWNSANCLTVLADFAALNPVAAAIAKDVFANTLSRGQACSLQMTKIIHNYIPVSFHWGQQPLSPSGLSEPSIIQPKGFLNDYYDDEGWWALAWIRVFDVTQNSTYLLVAATIFEDMKRGWSTPCGGIWWDKRQSYVSAISNELFLSVAAQLASRMADTSYYLDWALLQWAWFEQSGMINSKNLVNDGLHIKSCSNNHGNTWSYNQGVILGALVELAKVSQDKTYLVKAKAIASAAISGLTDRNGILHDPCEPHCGADGSQFKGIFLRNLQILQQAAPEDEYSLFIMANANSIWLTDRNRKGELGLVWSGPFRDPADASTHSSALDALVAAVTI
ncbi:hypothetical protein MMC13_003916 [Lambiella insularis]|nr:hypothetical protein [Lambiella insularis]